MEKIEILEVISSEARMDAHSFHFIFFSFL